MNIPEIAKCRGCNPEFAGMSPLVNTANGSQHWVFCPECGMHGPCGVGEQHAIERWNAICRQPTPEAALNTKMLAILQRLEDWGVREDKMFTETREKTLFKLISDAQTVLHKAKP